MAMKPNPNIIKQQKTDLTSAIGRHLTLLTALVVILILVVGYFILSPQYREVRIGGRNNLATREAIKGARLNQLTDLEKLVVNYQKLNQKDVEKLEQILPTEEDIPGLLVQLQALTEAYNFTLVSININQQSEEPKNSQNPNIRKLTLSLNLIGDNYQALKDFLEALEYNLRLFDVNAVYFAPDSDNYSISLITYYFTSAN